MTDQTIAPPSRNPTNDGHLKGVFKIVLAKFKQHQLDDMLPAEVLSYNRTTNLAQVQPLISQVTTLGQAKPRDQIASVPVAQIGGGGFMINFPIKKGDIGFIKSNDRDISVFKQVWAMCIPGSRRMHNFSDSVFLPMALVNFLIATADEDNLVIQALNASVRFSMGENNTCITDLPGYSQSPNCVLDVQSTSRAFAFPRMSSGQIAAIPSPFPGMAAYDLTTDGLRIYTAAGGWGF